MFLHSGMFQTTVQDVVLSWISVNTTNSSLACLQRTMSFGSNMAELQWAVFGAIVHVCTLQLVEGARDLDDGYFG